MLLTILLYALVGFVALTLIFLLAFLVAGVVQPPEALEAALTCSVTVLLGIFGVLAAIVGSLLVLLVGCFMAFLAVCRLAVQRFHKKNSQTETLTAGWRVVPRRRHGVTAPSPVEQLPVAESPLTWTKQQRRILQIYEPEYDEGSES